MHASERLALANLINRAKREYYTTGYRATDSEALGLLVSKYFNWDGEDILRTAESALEDANFHRQAAAVAEMADALKPSISDTDSIRDHPEFRTAIHAGYTERGYKATDRARRLASMSKIVGREVSSVNTLNVGEARHVLEVLNSL